MENQPDQLPEGVPDGSVIIATLTTSYYMSPDGNPIVNTSIEGADGDRPSYFEIIAMHKMSEKSIDQIYQTGA